MNGNRPVLSRRGFRLTAVIVGSLCVLAIAAGAFAFSYPGVRDTALTAGLSPRLARFYPLLFDAVLIVACAAAVMLRGVLRAYAWLAVLVIIGAVGTADTVHAMSITVPKRPLEATIAIAPWVVLLTGLTLLDAIIRRGPGRRTGAAGPVSAKGRAPAPGSPDPAAEQSADAVVVPLSTLMHDSPTAPASRVRTPAGQPAADTSRIRTVASAPAAGADEPEVTASAPQASAGPAAADPGPSAVAGSPAAVAQTPSAQTPSAQAPSAQAPSARPPERDVPGDARAGSSDPVTHFDRMRATPTPPEG